MKSSKYIGRGASAIAGLALILAYPSLYIVNFYCAAWGLSRKAGNVESTLSALSRATESGPVVCVEEGAAKAGRPLSARALERLTREARVALRDFFLHGLSDIRIALAFSLLDVKLSMTRGIDDMARIRGDASNYMVDFYPEKVFCREDDDRSDAQQRERLEEHHRKIADFLQQFREAFRDYESQKMAIEIIAWADIALVAVGYGILVGKLVRYARRRKVASSSSAC